MTLLSKLKQNMTLTLFVALVVGFIAGMLIQKEVIAEKYEDGEEPEAEEAEEAEEPLEEEPLEEELEQMPSVQDCMSCATIQNQCSMLGDM